MAIVIGYMYNKTTGEIIKTSTLEDCVAAADPRVGDEYRNYCVECLPEYVEDLTDTFVYSGDAESCCQYH